MTIAEAAIAEVAVAEQTRAPKTGAGAPTRRRIQAHGDAELIPEPR